MRNGATIKNTAIEGLDLTGSWDAGTQSYTALLSMGDLGCAAIENFDFQGSTGGRGVVGKNLLLNIDAIAHACHRGDCFNRTHNNFIRGEIAGGMYFDLCYPESNDLPPTQIYARDNYWDVGTPLAGVDYHISTQALIAGGSCKSANDVNFLLTPITTCTPTGTCTSCNGLRIGDFDETEDEDSITADAVVQAEYDDAYDYFIQQDTDSSRWQFADLSAVTLSYDSALNQWSAISINNEAYVIDDSSAQVILIAKVIQPVESEMLKTSSPNQYSAITDIFAGLQEERVSLPIELYLNPNPAMDKISITTSGMGIHYFAILNIVGQTVGKFPIHDKTTEIDVSYFPKGIYLVKAINEIGKQAAVKQLVVQ